MGSAIVYSKRLKGEVTARPYSFTGNIAVFAGMLSLKPCKIENISFDEKTELLVIVAESAGIVAERGEDSISFKGNPNPRGTYGEVTKGLFDNFSEIPYEPCGKEYFLRSDMPSDILIALFMGLVLAEDDSHVVFTNIPDSINTLELFINVLGRFGIYIESSNGGTDYRVSGDQRYSCDIYVNESDWEQAAFYLLAGAFGAEITVNGLNERTKQSGVLMLNPLRRMGAHFTDIPGGVVASIGSDGLHAASVSASECPEMLPAIMAAASVADGVTVISDIDSLDTPCYEAVINMKSELVKLGGEIVIRDGNISVKGKRRIRGGARVTGNGDLVSTMSLLAIAVVCEKALILNEFDEITEKYPGFADEYKQLGGCVGSFGR